MDLLFIGVGEACDSEHGNTSILVTSKETKTKKILLDCGFSVPHRFFNFCNDPDELDYLWISHFHGDHFFGLPLLLLRLREIGRKKPLTIIGQQEIRDKTIAVMELAYPGCLEKLGYQLIFKSINSANPLQLEGLSFKVTQTIHSLTNYGLLIDDGNHRLYYSGDGRPTDKVRGLIHGCDIVIHEAFSYEDIFHGHSSIATCRQLLLDESVKRLALVHIERTTRHNMSLSYFKEINQDKKILVPVSGTTLTI
jgi:ribonuclease BN (tRNA processing enzyme)